MPVASRMLAWTIVVGLTCGGGVADARSRKAASIADTVRSWGLLGTWATDCGRPAALDNSYLSFHAGTHGSVLHRRDYGHGRDVYQVQRAIITGDGLIDVVVDFKTLGGARRWTLAKGADGRIRAMANSKVDGSGASIRDGRFVDSGAEAPWQTRCYDEVVSTGSPGMRGAAGQA